MLYVRSVLARMAFCFATAFSLFERVRGVRVFVFVFIVFCACVVLCVLMCVWACAAFETWFVLLVVGGCRMLTPP